MGEGEDGRLEPMGGIDFLRCGCGERERPSSRRAVDGEPRSEGDGAGVGATDDLLRRPSSAGDDVVEAVDAL